MDPGQGWRCLIMSLSRVFPNLLSVPLKSHQDKSFGRPETVTLETFGKADIWARKRVSI